MTLMAVTALMFGSPAQPPLTLSVSGKSTKMLQKLFTCIGAGKAGKSGLTRVGDEGGRECGKRKGFGEGGLGKGHDGEGRVFQAVLE